MSSSWALLRRWVEWDFHTIAGHMVVSIALPMFSWTGLPVQTAARIREGGHLGDGSAPGPEDTVLPTLHPEPEQAKNSTRWRSDLFLKCQCEHSKDVTMGHGHIRKQGAHTTSYGQEMLTILTDRQHKASCQWNQPHMTETQHTHS